MDEDNKKIGFDSAPPLAKGEQVTFRKPKLTPFQRVALLSFIAATVFAIATASFYGLPVASGLFGLIIAVAFALVIIIPIFITLGIALVSDAFRAWIGTSWNGIEFLFSAADHIAEVSSYFLFLAWPALGLAVLSAILNTICVAQQKRSNISYLVFSCIYLVLDVILLIVFFTGGQLILGL